MTPKAILTHAFSVDVLILELRTTKGFEESGLIFYDLQAISYLNV